MELPIPIDRKVVIARNTFILALDGDIDFKPEAVRLLLDLMKKDPKLGAACGRIHPTGNGKIESGRNFMVHVCASNLLVACSLREIGVMATVRGGRAYSCNSIIHIYINVVLCSYISATQIIHTCL
jgi:chitin synthase